jgi:hypothetical protein
MDLSLTLGIVLERSTIPHKFDEQTYARTDTCDLGQKRSGCKQWGSVFCWTLLTVMKPLNYVVKASIHLPLTFCLQCESYVWLLLHTNLMALKERWWTWTWKTRRDIGFGVRRQDSEFDLKDQKETGILWCSGCQSLPLCILQLYGWYQLWMVMEGVSIDSVQNFSPK